MEAKDLHHIQGKRNNTEITQLDIYIYIWICSQIFVDWHPRQCSYTFESLQAHQYISPVHLLIQTLPVHNSTKCMHVKYDNIHLVEYEYRPSLAESLKKGQTNTYNYQPFLIEIIIYACLHAYIAMSHRHALYQSNILMRLTCVSTNAVRGRQSNKSVKYFQTFAFPYFLKHSSQKPYTCVICLLSWFPRRMVILSGQRTWERKNKQTIMHY